MPKTSQCQAVNVPNELHGVDHDVLEQYVEKRLLQFSPLFASRITPNPITSAISQAFFETLKELPPPEYSNAPLQTRNLQLRFTHSCLNIGCQDSLCSLCEHCPHRQCSSNFQSKYLVGDVLDAKCNAPIRVELYDAATGQQVNEDIPGASVEICVLDGSLYDNHTVSYQSASKSATKSTVAVTTKASITNSKHLQDVDRCALLFNKKNDPLLVPGPGGTIMPDHKVSIPLNKGVAELPSLTVTDSSEAILHGKRPPFRLHAKFVLQQGEENKNGAEGLWYDGRDAPWLPPSRRKKKNGQSHSTSLTTRKKTQSFLGVKAAMSEDFVVATRRTKTSRKIDVPNIDDTIGKLMHMGKETVKKLADLQGSAAQIGIQLQNLPKNSIEKVGEFKQLMVMAEADGHLRQKLQNTLKMSSEKWSEARDHAMRAVVSDSRMRIWYVGFPGSNTVPPLHATRGSDAVGLFFTCKLGVMDLDRPVGLLLHKKKERKRILPENPSTSHTGGAPAFITMNTDALITMEAVMMAQQTPQQRLQVALLHPAAVASWKQPGHPGWAIYPADSGIFLETGRLEQISYLDIHHAMQQQPSTIALAPTDAVCLSADLHHLLPGTRTDVKEDIEHHRIDMMSLINAYNGMMMVPPMVGSGLDGVVSLPHGMLASGGAPCRLPSDQAGLLGAMLPGSHPFLTSDCLVGHIDAAQKKSSDTMDGRLSNEGDIDEGGSGAVKVPSSPFAAVQSLVQQEDTAPRDGNGSDGVGEDDVVSLKRKKKRKVDDGRDDSTPVNIAMTTKRKNRTETCPSPHDNSKTDGDDAVALPGTLHAAAPVNPSRQQQQHQLQNMASLLRHGSMALQNFPSLPAAANIFSNYDDCSVESLIARYGSDTLFPERMASLNLAMQQQEPCNNGGGIIQSMKTGSKSANAAVGDDCFIDVPVHESIGLLGFYCGDLNRRNVAAKKKTRRRRSGIDQCITH